MNCHYYQSKTMRCKTAIASSLADLLEYITLKLLLDKCFFSWCSYCLMYELYIFVDLKFTVIVRLGNHIILWTPLHLLHLSFFPLGTGAYGSFSKYIVIKVLQSGTMIKDRSVFLFCWRVSGVMCDRRVATRLKGNVHKTTVRSVLLLWLGGSSTDQQPGNGQSFWE